MAKVTDEEMAWKREQAQRSRRGLPVQSGGWKAEVERRCRKNAEERVRSNLYIATNRVVKRGGTKPGRSCDLLGCTLAEARVHIERQFLPGMTWENHGAWHIDHLRPIASFDLTDPEQVRAAAHYTNLQPLWALDNLRKGARHDPSN